MNATKRLQFLKWARDNRLEERCFKRYRLGVYEPGHVRYQFGHYPSSKPYYPTEEDWKLLDLYAQAGVGVVHIWNWEDKCGYFGKGVFDPIHEKGLRRFIGECHRRRLKVIPYISPGYLDVRSPSYRAEWSRGVGHLVEVFYDLDILCPGSPGWRQYFMRNIEQLMDNYGFDGFYWDGGLTLKRAGCVNPHGDGHTHFVEYDPQATGALDHLGDQVDGVYDWYADLWGDFLSEIYARVKSRGGMIVAHVGSDFASPFKDRCWDYMLLGEGVGDVLASMEKTKAYDPYVIRFVDWSRLITDWKNKDLTPKLELVPALEHLFMAAFIPYLQFPWLEGGCYGEAEDVFSLPGVTWKKERDHWIEWMKALNKAGASAGFAGGRDRWLKYLALYKSMTANNTVAYLEVKGEREDVFPVTLGRRRVSVLINDFLWVAIGNLEKESQKVVVKPLDGKGDGQVVGLPAENLTVLRYYDFTSLPEVKSAELLN